ncbi:hypothetical protein [Paenibacillus sp.]|jgi:uncharacterized membrane-anchored protein YitT (DUF2179 family)|uniref:hypothetical protein n=1 Tax=Paenibacillus sp. TaxID=58172 RepID=UPI00281702DB|nr:hypothetical protein [Paenibacillus sp.]MDR0266564.1 hypothetical protein [Paenibacillus sp.]
MRTNKYWKYFDREIRGYKKRVISDEEVKEIRDARLNEMKDPLAEIPKDKPGYKIDEDEILQFVIQNEKVPDSQRMIR